MGCSMLDLLTDPAEIFLLCNREPNEVILDYSNWAEWQNNDIIFI